jgi:hypothetical protein
MPAAGAIGGAIKDVVFGRLTLLAIVNLILAGAISGSAVLAAIHYVTPLLPHATGWLGFIFDTARFLLGAGSIVLGIALTPAASMFVGGIIPPADALALRQMGVAGVYTPKDFKITGIMSDVVKLVAASVQRVN